MAEVRLKRYLHYGFEESMYLPGDRFFQGQFKMENLQSIQDVIAGNNPEAALNHIIKAFSDGYSTHPHAIIFALAYCARQNTSLPLRVAAYKAVDVICEKPTDFFLWVKFTNTLALNSGTGRGWKNAAGRWYLNKPPMLLAQYVTQFRKAFGWSHLSVLRLVHLKKSPSVQPAHLLLVNYIFHGLERAEKGMDSEDATSKDVLVYLNKIEEFKHSYSEEMTASMVNTYSFDPRFVLTPHKASITVLKALMPTIHLAKLLDLMQFILIRTYFSNGHSGLVDIICEVLRNPMKIAESGLHPIRVHIEKQTTKLAARTKIRKGNAIKLQKGDALMKEPTKQNDRIIGALHDLFNSTVKLLAPTGLRYLVAMDVSATNMTRMCWHCQYVSFSEAAAIIALTLFRTEREVTVGAISKESNLVPVEIEKKDSIEAVIGKLAEVPPGPTEIAKIIYWVEVNKKDLDVIIVIGHGSMKTYGVHEAFERYRKTTNPNCKLVVCCPTGQLSCHRKLDHPGMLCICGFDDKVCRVIEAFCRGAF